MQTIYEGGDLEGAKCANTDSYCMNLTVVNTINIGLVSVITVLFFLNTV